MVAIRFSSIGLDKIQVLIDLVGEDLGTSRGEIKVFESLTQSANRIVRWVILASERTIDGVGDSIQEMFDSENFQMGIVIEEKSTDVFVSYEVFIIITTYIGLKTGGSSDSREARDLIV